MSIGFRLRNCPVLVGLAFQMGAVLAQIAPPPDYDQKLGDVVINATRSGTPLDQIPLNTTILTKEVLESSPDQTIDQVLKNVPGVFLNDVPYYQKDPTGQSINVRGLGYGRTLVLIDGLPANDAFYGTVQWNLVPMSSIETVNLFGVVFQVCGVTMEWVASLILILRHPRIALKKFLQVMALLPLEMLLFQKT